MAPIRRLSEWSAEDLGMRSQGVSSVGFKNKNVKQRTWRSNHPQAFVGSVREGQGFAFRRKLKIQQNYKKLLWKEKKAQTSQESQFTDRYPEHLKHLYLAEEKRLRKQLRKVEQPLSEEEADQPLGKEQCGINQALSEYCSFEQPQSAEQCNIRMKERESKSEHRQHGRQSQREKQAPCEARSPMWDSIPGRWDHDLSRRQLLNQLSHPGIPGI
ncbi:thyroid transcription factor 1-associated protein 26 isoform X2 [Mustela nigripes]|uniref:thyroid transcription factor 1-associated protein 26 isoform X2 n=1 Tax=Mustela lutreola TaxID=9666 RepID=UPI0027970752|nr:thyroid transcription factor 1-associated protein 26 isoform X2 [Mustela lutreola]XP_059258373.1 thyroid transcription factor 1-associated protein 26 isoform X2 [Mustela nigripes]